MLSMLSSLGICDMQYATNAAGTAKLHKLSSKTMHAWAKRNQKFLGKVWCIRRRRFFSKCMSSLLVLKIPHSQAQHAHREGDGGSCNAAPKLSRNLSAVTTGVLSVAAGPMSFQAEVPIPTKVEFAQARDPQALLVHFSGESAWPLALVNVVVTLPKM